MRTIFAKYILTVCLFLGASSLMANDSPAPSQEDSKTAMITVTKWFSYICSGFDQKIVDLYSSDITFFSTSGDELITDLNGVSHYFAMNEEKFKNTNFDTCTLISPKIKIMSDSSAVVTGIDEFTGSDQDGQNIVINGRQTFVLNKEGSHWKIVHHHRSKIPQ